MEKGTPVYDICSLSEAGRDDILVSRFAPYLTHHKNLSAAHRHTFYHLVLFTQGAGKHTIDFESFEVRPYQVYFMIPGQVHSWAFEGFTDGYIINFSAVFFQSFLLKAGYIDGFSFFGGDVKAAVIDLPEGTHSQISQLFEEIIKEYETVNTNGLDMLRLLILQVFILVGRVNGRTESAGPASYNQLLLKSFQKLIEDNYTNLKLPKDYAGLLYITPNHLNAVCKDLLGMPAGDVIRNRTILEAKRLLTNPKLNITEIAFQLNFNDNSYFTKFFKKVTGMGPEEFRQNILSPHHHAK